MTKKSGLSVKLLAISSSEEGQKSYRYIKLHDVHNYKYKKILILSSDVNDPKILKRRLIDEGLSLEMTAKDWGDVYSELTKVPKKRVRLCIRPGYIDKDGFLSYLTMSGEFYGRSGNEELKPLPYPGSKSFPFEESCNGTLDEWKYYVAALALHSPQMTLAMCSAFAGYCCYLSDIETGGFHFYGNSSSGKSTALHVAASIRGDKQLVKSWKMTDTAFEETAEAYNDNLLILDELKLSNKKQEHAAQDVQHLIYMLSEGQGKKRSVEFQKTVHRWRMIILSAGERSLGQHAQDGGIEKMDGEKTRLIDIPIKNDGGDGIFDSIPADFDSGTLSETIQYNCSKYYGAAGECFLSNLVARNKQDSKDLIKKHVNAFLDTFLKSEGGVQRRIAKRFALAYAAGMLAVKYKILPSTYDNIASSVGYCYHLAISTSTSKLGCLFSKEFIDYFLSEMVVDSRSGIHKRDDLESSLAFIVDINNVSVFAIDNEYLSNNLLISKKDCVALLKNKGIIYSDAQGKSTRQITYQGRGMTRRYCLKLQPFMDLLNGKTM
ncbi:DUF927 domain-containing protein [Scandinavium sp. H11S7]|uniref:DUF927 domain-containing protein n=1 Tax=Scandinavium hiltneri TaxID=2926519 RepID=A0ABT2E121_9ENTR|nr:DUF927 domain-containing protein [Scandinavium hiltneri]MCS2161568.1 DUF927 domain-containing protein [Scandinavium hiltneri]